MTAHEIQIGAATPDDLEALVELLGILFAHEHEFSPDPAKQRVGLTRILANPGIGQLFVVRAAHDRVVGLANLLYSESTFLGKPVAWLEDIVVHPEYRSQGVGEALIGHVLHFAQARGLARVSLITDFDNASAQRLYRKLGFERSSMTLMRRVF